VGVDAPGVCKDHALGVAFSDSSWTEMTRLFRRKIHCCEVATSDAGQAS
jgi:hypothetical protein